MRAADAIKEASNLSLRFPISSSKKDIVVTDAEDEDAEAVDRIGEMLDVSGDENSRYSCFDTLVRLEESLEVLLPMVMGEDREAGDDLVGERDRCRCRWRRW